MSNIGRSMAMMRLVEVISAVGSAATYTLTARDDEGNYRPSPADFHGKKRRKGQRRAFGGQW